MRRLRAECGWKSAQTHRSLARYLLEEAHEALEAIDVVAETGDAAPLREELGDVLLQVCFHAAVAEERGDFDLDDVAAGLVAKLRRRNPHVFAADGPAPADARAVNELWESVKAAEKPRASLVDGLPPTLPALLLADKVLDRLARREGAPPAADDLAPGTPEAEVAARAVGDDLLAVLAGARGSGVDPEQALRDAVRRLLAARDPLAVASDPPTDGEAGAAPRRR
nr:MazG nucleotide pyrophosphohydrolase domain-containing protein [Nocardioides perillae]